VRIAREEFGKAMILSKDHVSFDGQETRRFDQRLPQQLSSAHCRDRGHDRHSTDIKPLEVLLFMRAVKSRLLFEQIWDAAHASSARPSCRM